MQRRGGGSRPSHCSDHRVGARYAVAELLPAVGKEKRPLSPLAKKLRLQPDYRVAIINPPDGYIDRLAPAPTGIGTDLQPLDLFAAVQLFVNGVEELRDLPSERSSRTASCG
ncbi:MAG TPA: hypothetical protein VND96_04930 [Candidatus Micrarchaeaceae archaeon]|nr:hypothetical protein [Candidatus Micrarchaeaceae archaeon]